MSEPERLCCNCRHQKYWEEYGWMMSDCGNKEAWDFLGGLDGETDPAVAGCPHFKAKANDSSSDDTGGVSREIIVELQAGCWLAEGEGDPPRTLVRENARVFNNYRDAVRSLVRAERRYSRTFKNAYISNLKTTRPKE